MAKARFSMGDDTVETLEDTAKIEATNETVTEEAKEVTETGPETGDVISGDHLVVKDESGHRIVKPGEIVTGLILAAHATAKDAETTLAELSK